MTYLDAGDGATDTVVPRGEILTLRVIGGRAFRNHAPEQYDGLIESAAFVNWRRLEAGDDAIIALAFS